MTQDKAKKAIAKKKRWFDIAATKPYEGYFLGETFAATHEEKIGTKLALSLSVITGESNRQNLQAKFLISKFVDNVLRADLIGGFMFPSAVKKLVRRNKDKLDQSFTVKTKDGHQVRLKTVVITRHKTTGIVLAKLSKQIVYHLTKTVSQRTYQDFLTHLLSRRIHKGLQDYLKKTYPVATCEVRSFELILGKGQEVPQLSEETTPAAETAPLQVATPTPAQPSSDAASAEQPKKRAPRAKKPAEETVEAAQE